jgi:ligand-binding sensor domain-containing protein
MNFLISTITLLLFFSCDGQKRKTVELKEPKAYTSADIVTSSLKDKNGDLWFGTTTEGLYRFNDEKFSNFNEDNGLCTNQIWDIIEDNKGIIWLATNKGLCKYDGKTFTQISLPYIDVSSDWYQNIYPTVNPNQANSLIQDNNGIFWIGTSGGGAYKYDGTTFQNILAEKGRKYEDSLHHNVIQSIIQDKNGNIWFASMSNGGITKYDGETFQEFKTGSGLSDNMVRYVYQDQEGNIWIGTNGNRNGGLDKFNGENFRNFNESNGLCSNNVSIIYQSKDGTMWFGSDRGGICYLENGEFIQIKELSEISIRTIIEDRNRNMWFGGRKGNILKYDGEKLTDLTHLKNE